jgi:hypothetical protein
MRIVLGGPMNLLWERANVKSIDSSDFLPFSNILVIFLNLKIKIPIGYLSKLS